MPIQATFTGRKSVPYLAIATNSLSPKFRLFEDEIELAVIQLHRRRLSDLESVDAINWKLSKRGIVVERYALDFHGGLDCVASIN